VLSQSSLHVAVAAELFPILNQGGNIRLSRILETLTENDCLVTLYVREIESPKRLYLGRNIIPVIADGLWLNRLGKEVANYDVILSSFWFWRTEENPKILPIPLIVSEFIAKEAVDVLHIASTDDLQYVRCAKTARDEQWCAKVFSMEVKVWEDPLVFKLFIAAEDMYHARNISRMSAASSSVLSYFQTTRQHNQVSSNRVGLFGRDNTCTVAYFGNAHPANVQALLQLFESSSEAVLEFHLTALQQKCTLLIAGDSRWEKILQTANVESLQDFGVSVEIVGYVKDLSALMRRVTLMMLPVTVGGTGISSKIFSCIEMGVPFISSDAGNRGFRCDAECEQLFFRTSIKEVLVSALEMGNDSRLLQRSRAKLRDIFNDDIGHASLLDLLLRRVAVKRNLLRHSEDTSLEKKGKLACSICSEDDECTRVCEVTKKRQNNTEVSVYASVKGSESEKSFLVGYLLDVFRQDMLENWEVVLATASTFFFELTIQTLTDLQETMPDSLRIRVVHMEFDRGLYETWDYLISSQSEGRFLQNWNIDDRKHRSAIRFKYNILSTQPLISLVSSAVLVSRKPNEFWYSLHKQKNFEEWFREKYGFYGLHTLFQKNHKGKFSSLNLPHNSPLYRRVLHEKYGTFSAKWQISPLRLDISPTCSDFRFWTLPLQAGENFYHTNMPLEVYYVRKDSHMRLPENNIDNCVQQVVSSVFPPSKKMTGKLGLDTMSTERVFLFIKSHEEIASGKNTILEVVSRILRNGYRLHLLVSETAMDLSRDIFPEDVLISSYQRQENPGYFKFGIFLTDSMIEVSSTQLRTAGFYLPHRKTYHVRNVEEMYVLVFSEL